MNIESATMPNNPNQLILFIGDYVRLHDNFYGDDAEWLNICDIEPYDICVLSNGARVCASTEYIAGALSPIEYREMF